MAMVLNHKEMLIFYNIIKEYFKNRNVYWEVKTNQITNWGTYTEEEYLEKNVTNPAHKDHKQFLEIVEQMKDLPFFVNNFNHLYTKTKVLI